MEPNTGYYACVVEDSVNPAGSRLTTNEVGFPRFILAELNTHRILSRNSASSRAIPVAKQLERIEKYPFVPEAFPINKPGMSATEYLYPGCGAYVKAKDAWLRGRDKAMETAQELLDLNVHKQTANRVLEPYMWHSAVITASDYRNFYALRISPHAQPEINKIAEMMRDAMDESTPSFLKWGQWHLPYVSQDELDGWRDFDLLAKISSGRCAAVTLLNQQKKDPEKDIARTESLLANGHMSPLEHPAQADNNIKSGFPDYPGSNFDGTWLQYRKCIPGEAVYDK